MHESLKEYLDAVEGLTKLAELYESQLVGMNAKGSEFWNGAMLDQASSRSASQTITKFCVTIRRLDKAMQRQRQSILRLQAQSNFEQGT